MRLFFTLLPLLLLLTAFFLEWLVPHLWYRWKSRGHQAPSPPDDGAGAILHPKTEAHSKAQAR
jgi:hypothetical protein